MGDTARGQSFASLEGGAGMKRTRVSTGVGCLLALALTIGCSGSSSSGDDDDDGAGGSGGGPSYEIVSTPEQAGYSTLGDVGEPAGTGAPVDCTTIQEDLRQACENHSWRHTGVTVDLISFLDIMNDANSSRIMIVDKLRDYGTGTYSPHGTLWQAYSREPLGSELVDGLNASPDPTVVRIDDAEICTESVPGNGTMLTLWFVLFADETQVAFEPYQP